MELILEGIGRLTDDHGASFHGHPVLVLEGEVEETTDPGDLLDWDGCLLPAADLVRRWAEATGNDDHALVRAFVG